MDLAWTRYTCECVVREHAIGLGHGVFNVLVYVGMAVMLLVYSAQRIILEIFTLITTLNQPWI